MPFSRVAVVNLALLLLIAAITALATTCAPGLVASPDEVRGRGPLPLSEETVKIKVASGASGDGIARQMERAGVISDAGLFTTVSGLMGLQSRLAAGDYEFTRGVPVVEAIRRLRTGVTVPTVTITIPEGRRLEEVAAIFERHGMFPAADFIAAAQAADYPQSFVQQRPPGSSLDGYLFPDTYFFEKKTSARDVVQRLLTTFDERFTTELRAAAKAHGLELHQAVTIAAIVEREAQVAEERPIIAAVYINRIKIGMPLQADPTVQYALTADPKSVEVYGWWKRDLTLEDLKVASPYNTYQNAGLPPGPIASPGLAALRAVAQPATVKHLYFVAKGDGSHAFADTLDEHNRNVARYQR